MRAASITGGCLLAMLFVAACGSSSSKSPDAGTGGSSAGGAAGEGVGGTGDNGGEGGTFEGTGGHGGSGSGGSAPFTVVAPCAAASDYVTGSTVTFPNANNSYSPKCLQVALGDTVTFMGDFSIHPLEASRQRGNTADNPITTTQGMMSSHAFTFSAPGFFAYYCTVHGAADDGSAMSGVIWAK